MALAAELGIDPSGLYASWKRRGLSMRSASDAARLRHVQHPDTTIEIAQAARRGTKDSMAVRERRAVTREARGLGISGNERRLAEVLRELAIPFRQQAAIGPYNADFAFDDLRLVVEIDGGGHNTRVRDLRAERTAFIQDSGWRVVHVETRRRDWMRVVVDHLDEHRSPV